MVRPSEQVLYLEFLTSDSSRFIPVYFSEMDGAIRQPDTRDALAFAPATTSIHSLQSGDFVYSGSYGERLDIRNVAQNLEMHERIVARPCDIVNGRNRMEGAACVRLLRC